MIPIVNEGAFDEVIRNQVNQNFAQANGIAAGNFYFLDPWKGSNNNSGLYPSQAVATLAAGYAKLREGKNDVLVLMANGLATASARINAAFTWSKNEAHLVGACAPVYMSQRSRIAPTSGATAFANFFTISGNGCIFQNIQWFQGFDTGTTSQIAITLSSATRNLFQNCHIAGMGDAASAQNTGSRNLKITGGGEHVFRNCTIGIDTVARTVANASVEFASGTARNVFEDCLFPVYASTLQTQLVIKTAAAAAMDRFQLFNRCSFLAAVGSAGLAVTALATLAASSGGVIVLKDCTTVGFTDLFSDATTAGQMYIDGGAPTAAATALAVNPA